MQVERIIVRAGRTVPHPLHQYGNLTASLEIVAIVDEGDDPEQLRRQLQQRIESDIEQHMVDLKDGIEDMQEQLSARRRIAALEQDLERKNQELEHLRDTFDETPLFKPKREPAPPTAAKENRK